MQRCFRHVLLFAAASAFACSAALAQGPTVIKLSHVVSPETAKGKAALKFNDAEEIEALQLGSVQILIPAVAKFGPLGLTDFDVFDLPYMFPDLNALHRVTRGRSAAGCSTSSPPRGSPGCRSGTTRS